MKQRKKYFLLIFISLTLFSCNIEIPNTNNSETEKETQDKETEVKIENKAKEETNTEKKVDRNFVLAFDAEPKKGLKFTFVTSATINGNTNDDLKPQESSFEILEVNEKTYKVKETNLNGVVTREANKDDPGNIPEEVTLLGKENIIVPAGEYKEATKITFEQIESNENISVKFKYTMWLVEKIGPVKMIQESNTLQITTELKEFIS